MHPARPNEQSHLLSTGALTLDAGARCLIGPSGTTKIGRGPFILLRAVMRCPGATVDMATLTREVWPDFAFAPSAPAHTLRMHAVHARKAMAHVGADPKTLRSVHKLGYMIEGEAHIVRVYKPAQAEALDRLLASHPDAQLVATLATVITSGAPA